MRKLKSIIPTMIFAILFSLTLYVTGCVLSNNLNITCWEDSVRKIIAFLWMPAIIIRLWYGLGKWEDDRWENEMKTFICAVVTEVLSEPTRVIIKEKEYWTVKFKYNCYGAISERERLFYSKEDAEIIQVGYKFEA